jgi:hypothetical protein
MGAGEIARQIAALNKADIAFRLAEWQCQEAETASEQRRYAKASLRAALQRAFVFALLEKHQVVVNKFNGEYVQKEYKF